MSETDYTLSPLGFLHSPLKSREEAPNQGREGAPDAWLEVNERVAEGLEGLVVGDEILLITGFHRQSLSGLRFLQRYKLAYEGL